MYRYIVLLTLLVFLAIRSAYAIDVLELYHEAEQNDPEFKVANSERLAVQETKPQVQALLVPQVTLGGSVMQNLRTEEALLMGDRFENTSIGYNLVLEYPLYRRDVNVQVKQVDSKIQQAETQYESAKQVLMEKVASSYFEVLSSNDDVKFTKTNKETINSQLEQVKQRFDVGLIAITDLQEAKAGYDLAVAEELQAKNTLDSAKEALREITGKQYDVYSTLKDEIPLLTPEPADMEKWAKLAVEGSPRVLAVQHSVETAKQEIERQKSVNLPTVNLVANHSYGDVLRGDEIPGNYRTDTSVGIQVRYSLFEGGAKQARVREAQQRYTQAQDSLEQVRRAVQRETTSAYLNVLSNISQITALKQALVSTQTALEAVKAGYDVGTRTLVDVLNAQRDVLRAQRDYSRVRYQYVINTLRLKRAAGIINVDDLKKINGWLEASQ